MSDFDFSNMITKMPNLDLKPSETEDKSARQAIRNTNAALLEIQSKINGLYAVAVASLSNADEGTKKKVLLVRDQLEKQDPKAARFVDTILNSIVSRDTPVQ